MKEPTGEDFLKKKYDLHKAPETEEQAERTEHKTGEKVPQDPEARISNYLKRFSDILERPSGADLGPEEKGAPTRERGVEAFKRLMFRKFVTKPEDIPESYWKSQEAIIRERGQKADYDRFSDEEKEKWKREISEGLLDDQRASLEQWIDYFASDDSEHLPDPMKYWVFRSVTKLQEYDKDKKVFPKRSKGTVKMFPDLNQEALSYVVDAIKKKLGGKKHEFEGYDIQTEEAFEKALKNENFADLYAWASELMNPIPEHLLPVTEGEWTLYEQNSESDPLVGAIRGKGTGWCTAGENTAKVQLKGGSFHLYRTLDDDGEPTIPRIAIRMKGDKIAEVRGIAKQQNLDPYMPGVLEEKLQEFPDKEEYLKKDRDMKILTKIERKMNNEEPLGKDELMFLYEIDSKIEGFGYSRDPRIQELRESRDPEVDMLIVFECEPSQIARTLDQINEDTRAYVGPLEPGIFTKLAAFDIEHIYTDFPERPIRRQTMEVGGKTREELLDELKAKGFKISGYANAMMDHSDFITSPDAEDMDFIRLSVADLNIQGVPTTDAIYARAQELGLDLVPPDAGPAYRLATLDQSMDDWVYMGMKQSTGPDGDPRVFGVGRGEDGLWLDYYWARPVSQWRPGNGFVFALRKSET